MSRSTESLAPAPEPSNRRGQIGPEVAADSRSASLGRRANAFLIDAVVLGILLAVLVTPALLIGKDMVLDVIADPMKLVFYENEERTRVLGFALAMFAGLSVYTLCFWLYHAVPTSRRWQGTLGKRIVGIAVVRAGTGEAVGFWRATGRVISYWVAALIMALFVGGLDFVVPGLGTLLFLGSYPAVMLGFAARRSDRRSLHDIVCGTRVIDDPRRDKNQ